MQAAVKFEMSAQSGIDPKKPLPGPEFAGEQIDESGVILFIPNFTEEVHHPQNFRLIEQVAQIVDREQKVSPSALVLLYTDA